MKTLIILILATTCHAGKIIMTDPVLLDTALPVRQVDRYLTYYAIKELQDSGITVSGPSIKRNVLKGKYGSRTKDIFQKSRVDSFRSLFSLLYLSLHFKSAEDCNNRGEAMQWFLLTGEKLGLPEEDLKDAEDFVWEIILGLCSDLYRGEPLGEPVIPSP